jgi:hypothetical protein
MPSRRRLLALSATGVAGLAGCLGQPTAPCDRPDGCPDLGDSESVCPGATDSGIALTTDTATATPEDPTVEVTLANNTDGMFFETGPRRLARRTPDGWVPVGRDEWSGTPTFIPQGDATTYSITFRPEPDDGDTGAITAPSGECGVFAFHVSGSPADGPEQTYVVTVTTEF